MAVGALIANLLVPGVGSLIVRRKTEGVWQLVTFGLGLLFLIAFIGYVAWLAAWIWALVTSVQVLQVAGKDVQAEGAEPPSESIKPANHNP